MDAINSTKTSAMVEKRGSYSVFPSYMYGPRTTVPFSTVTEAFFHFVSNHPQAIALRDLSAQDVTETTYIHLFHQSYQLAQKLRDLGVTRGSRVPLLVKRGTDMIVGILAILLCGAQYVPLDGGVVPESTLRYVIEQAGAKSCTVVTIQSVEHRLKNLDVAQAVVIDVERKGYETSPAKIPTYKDLAKPEDGCYVIYTSGKTNRQKRIRSSITDINVQGPLGLPKELMLHTAM